MSPPAPPRSQTAREALIKLLATVCAACLSALHHSAALLVHVARWFSFSRTAAGAASTRNNTSTQQVAHNFDKVSDQHSDAFDDALAAGSCLIDACV